MDKQVIIYSLGGLTLHYDGQLVAGLASRKMEALLVYLAYTGRLHSREHLADLFWTDSPLETGLGNVRVMLSRLRKSFPDQLLTNRQTVGLAKERVWCDASDLVQRLDEVLAQWRDSARLLPSEVGQMEAAIALYKGSFLESVSLKEADAFDSWVSQERERISSLIMEASFALAELYQRQHSHENAKRVLRNALRIDPLEEIVYRQLMQVAWEQGQQDLALETYQQLKTVLEDELGTAPSSETASLLRHIQRSGTAHHSQKAVPLRLPQDSSVFVGRSRELSEISSRLRDDECRLLTILGLGGVGKTRLSIAVARILAADADSFPDGIFFVTLEEVPLNLIIPSIGAVLGNGGYTLETMAQVGSFLSERKVLLILDNFEHLVVHSEILSELLQAAPKLKMLITSRERLQLREEWLYDVHGLDCPDADTIPVLEASEAVQMLHSATKQAGLRLALGQDGREIAQLCRLVNGMPLALEMAAALLRDFSLEQLLQRMEASMDTLRSGLKNIPQRQMNLRVLFDSLWERLSSPEQGILLRLAVFTGSISKEAAVAVAGAKPRDLASLQDRLLLREAGIGRYSLHPLIRQYAFEKLATVSKNLFENQTTHAQYFSHFLSSRAEIINSSEFRPACDVVELEIENVRAVWQFSANSGSAVRLLEMLHPLAKYFVFMERNEQGEMLFASAAGANLPRALQGWILAYRAYFLQNLRRFAPANELLLAAETLLQASHDSEGLSFVLMRRIYHRFTGEKKAAEALAMTDDIIPLVQNIKHSEYIANAFYMRGAILSSLGRQYEAESVLQEAIALQPKNPKLYADCLWVLGMTYFRREQMTAALEQFERVLAFDRDCQFEAHYAHILIIYGSTQMVLGRYQDAEQSYLQCLAYYDSVKNLGAIAIAYERMGELCLRTNRADEAFKHYRRSLELNADSGNWTGYIHILANWAATFQSMNWAHPMARESYQEAIAVAEREDIAHSKAHAFRVAAAVELIFEDYPLVLKYLRQSIALYTSLENEDGLRLAAQELFKYGVRTDHLELAAWLKAAFLADPNTDEEILRELREADDLPVIGFEKAPNLLELEQELDHFLVQQS